jgi:hypothetical protein
VHANNNCTCNVRARFLALAVTVHINVMHECGLAHVYFRVRHDLALSSKILQPQEGRVALVANAFVGVQCQAVINVVSRLLCSMLVTDDAQSFKDRLSKVVWAAIECRGMPGG